MIAPGATGHGGPEARGTHATQETAGTSNPSNEVNANSEYIDIMRKIPRILCERYELLDVLGKGAHGRIYLATDLVTHDRVAIKLVSALTVSSVVCFRWRSPARTSQSSKEKYR